MRKEEYIREVISRIENKKAQKEVERELSAHIDDRISYYADAGYDEQTANEKAMEHMGNPESVSEEMAKLHPDRQNGVFKALSVVILLHAVVSILLNVNVSTGYPWYFIDEGFYIVFIVVLALLFNGLIYLFARISHRRDSFLVIPLLGMETAVAVISLLAEPFSDYFTVVYPFVNLIFSAVMIVLSVIACRWRDKKEKGAKAVIAPLLSALPVSVAVVIALLAVYMIVPNIISLAIDRNANNLAKQHYLEDMPWQEASANEKKLYNISDYVEAGESINTEKGDTDNWYVNEEKVKPVKKLCEKAPDKAYEPSYVYWVTDADGILMRSSIEAEDMIFEEFLISKDYKFPDTASDGIKSVSVYGNDITEAFDGNYLKSVLQSVRYWDSSEIIQVNARKVYKLCWTFQSDEKVYLYKAFLLESSDGGFSFSPWLRKTSDKNEYESFGRLVDVDEETSARLHELLKDVPCFEEWYSFPETVYSYFDFDE